MPALVFVLMPVNWACEAFKWRQLLQHRYSFGQLVKSVLVGVTMGFVTPGRVGEFAGRTIYLHSTDRVQAFYLGNLGGLAQMLVTCVFGSLFFQYWYPDPFVSGLMIGATAVLALLYFRYDWLTAITGRVKWLAGRSLHMQPGTMPGPVVLWRVLGLSGVRYAVYAMQYYLAFGMFCNEADALALFSAVVTMLLFQAFSPFVPILDVPYRGSVVLLVFGTLIRNESAILLAALGVWFLNLVIPAVVGYYYTVQYHSTSNSAS